MAGAGRTRTVMQVGFTAITVAYFLYIFMLSSRSWGWSYKIVAPFVAVAQIVGYLRYRARRRADQRIAEDMSENGRPTVIYLRSFDTDVLMMKNLEPIPNMLTSLLAYPVGPNADTEDPLASALAPIGKMIKLGRPGERSPVLGAVRVYAPDDQWRDEVDAWLARAELVILRVGTTGGLWWETARVHETVSAEKVLFYMLGTSRTLYDSAAERMRVELGIDLPCFAEVQHWGRVSGFFMFGVGWKPRFLPIAAPYWRTSWFRPMKGLFHYTLEPVYVSHGLDWSPLAISKTKILLTPMPFIGFGCVLLQLLLFR